MENQVGLFLAMCMGISPNLEEIEERAERGDALSKKIIEISSWKG